jgi:hypothetical protein
MFRMSGGYYILQLRLQCVQEADRQKFHVGLVFFMMPSTVTHNLL